MRYCNYCGAEIPAGARFCGICGHIPGDATKSVTGIMSPSQANLSPSATPPLFDSSPSRPFEGTPVTPPGVDETIKQSWSEQEELNLQTWDYIDRQNDESTATAVWPDGIAPLAAGGFGQFPASNAPVVSGTPQIGGVPSVPGSPQMGNAPGVQGGLNAAGNPPPMHELAHQAPPSAPQHTWTWEQHPSHPPLHHQHPAPPEQRPPARKLRWRGRHEGAGHEHAKTPHTHRLHLGRAHKTGVTTASKAATGVAAKWAIIVLTAIVVMASGGIIFVLASSPTLSLNGSSTVSVGGTLQLHGRGFLPGGTITLTLDNVFPVALAAPRSTGVAGAGAANLADALQSEQAQSSNGSIVVGITGTFDANVVAQSSWTAGKNVLHARESPGSRSADLPFTLFAQPAHMVVNPAALDFGSIPQGGKVAESVLIANTGSSPLSWNAATDGSPWLALQSSNGTLQPGGAQDALYVLVDAGKLKQGTYSGEIVIHSNGGDAQIAVHIRVGLPVAARQAQLNVNPSHLDFGQLTPGQRVSNTVTIGNQGSLALQWQAITSGAGWLSLSVSNGSVQPGAVPQNIQVTVDTNSSSLQAGSNTAAITIHSNGGDATIPVTLTLSSGNTPTPTPSPSPSPSPIPSPTPSPSPTVLPTTWSVSPTNLNTNSCSGSSTWTCTVTLTEGTGSPGNINWSATDSLGSASFSPGSGTLRPGASTPVTISSIPCQNDSFTFTDSAGAASPISASWTCVVQQARGTASLGSWSYTAGSGWSCPVTIAASGNNKVDWPWNASSSGVSGI